MTRFAPGAAPLPQPDELLPVIGAATANLVELLRVFAEQEETILLAGPTGSGKSRLARWCHARSKRHARPLEILDILGVAEDLQVGELFGWRRGAFTGAIHDNPGALARAEGGTLFIDEIDKLTLKSQASLLRVLEERSYRPMGERAGDRRANVRFLVGTNADLTALVRVGGFREDLYYRINVLLIKVPPLDERADEIPQWSRYMLARRHEDGGGEGRSSLAPEAERLLAARSWPGNLRQLDNILRRAYALALADRGAARDLSLEARHVTRALACEAPAEMPLVDVLHSAASAFVRETARRAGTGSPLSVDHASAFLGLVLGAAVERHGGRDEAFRALGRADLLKGRNHHRVLRRELDRARALLAALEERADGPLVTSKGAR
jgi:DNA-binding NtrC family response regulator